MSDTAATPKTNVPWTDTERVGFLFQIIEKLGGSIPWDELTLPNGRTKKACQVMVDKEKTKIRKAREDAGLPPSDTPAKSTKRKGKAAKAADGDDEEGNVESPTKKKKATPRKKKSQEVVKDEEGEEKVEVKAEGGEDADF